MRTRIGRGSRTSREVSAFSMVSWNHSGVFGSPGNPMGRVKMFFREPDLYIHGTSLPSSLGRARSHGCVRMRNTDVVELARMVMVNAGEPKTPEWFQETIAKPDTSREVRLPRPMRVRIRQ